MDPKQVVGGAVGALRDPKELVTKIVDMAGEGATTAKTLAATGIARPARPGRLARALRALQQYGLTPAAAFMAAAELDPDLPSVIDEKGTLTYKEIHERTSRLANALKQEGIGEGDAVGVLCRNHRGFVEAVIALSKLGANALLLNTGMAGPQLAEVMDREQAEAIVYDEEFTGLLQKSLEGHKGFLAWTEGEDDGGDTTTLDELIERGDDRTPPAPGTHGRTTILTSGTTGTPKGASRGGATVSAATAILGSIPLKAREKVLVAAPLFHQWGFAHFQLAMLLRSTLVLQRKFKPDKVLEKVAEEQVSVLPMVPVMAQRILELDQAKKDEHDTSSLRVVPLSGSALPGDVGVNFMDEFGDVLYNLYGSTEVAWVAIAGPQDLRDAPGTAGRPPHGTIVKIFDDDDNELPAGETGRIFVGNDMLFEGYTGGGSKDTIDGLMATGDVGHFDEEGRLFVDGRDDDMIVSGGENVFPQEVEDVLARHDRVREAAVVGVDDEQFGQRLKAFVVKEGDVDEDTLKSHVKENLANYKVPREIEFLDELPRSEQGKVLKRELERDGADEAGEGSGSGDGERTSKDEKAKAGTS